MEYPDSFSFAHFYNTLARKTALIFAFRQGFHSLEGVNQVVKITSI
jgi:hypothetical protein